MATYLKAMNLWPYIIGTTAKLTGTKPEKLKTWEGKDGQGL